MKNIISTLLIILISNSVFSQCKQYVPLSIDIEKNGKEFWTKKEWNTANTARFHFYMSKRVRESIRLHNLVRMYPDKFSSVYLF